jgi:hypothetical protein
MTKKADFNAEEWSQVLEGPAIAGMIVITAQRGGTIRESISLAKAYTEAREKHDAGELLDEIVEANPQIDEKEFGSAEALRENGIQRLRDAVALLEAKATPEEVGAYRGFVVGLAQRVAEAHKEGGVLGVGGEEVGEAEQAALEEIKEAVAT